MPTLLLDRLLFSAVFLYMGANIEWAYANVQLIQTIALSSTFLGIAKFTFYTYLS